MTCSIQDVLKHYEYDPSIVQRVGKRTFEKLPLQIEPPDPAWPQQFQTLKSIIQEALGHKALSISHVGSTAVPNLPAKAIIDIDLTVPDPTAEATYIPALESKGFQFLTREPTCQASNYERMAYYARGRQRAICTNEDGSDGKE
ncbi:hypothetical protein BFJ66_g10816 [Fusarium oxysporum f. sp. cepae]|uniref:GrpB domain protein n=1 Tax=Fusarium oxysporum f. sp. cepae TaxID=396571 RepID=A0A3L6NDU3_FUSOX|nr:hypothetical protein BFJ65_g9476 [Fusarium oxysporum f. sp. cepae]RKK35569.1 hypothetical protein BFJ67_g13213 [Fusarium oxysporum f. sp. cepae]RKK41731.1 hypothetical protein BFJ66_g10816 [Fusarium oxysporum f. sp. cepae]